MADDQTTNHPIQECTPEEDAVWDEMMRPKPSIKPEFQNYAFKSERFETSFGHDF